MIPFPTRTAAALMIALAPGLALAQEPAAEPPEVPSAPGQAQDAQPGEMMPGASEGERRERGDRRGEDRHGMERHHGMMDGARLRMMMILIDTDGDGALSLEEVQAVHERIFRAADTDGDDRVTPEEMRAFMQGMHGTPPR